jgi:hypothetical protein
VCRRKGAASGIAAKGDLTAPLFGWEGSSRLPSFGTRFASPGLNEDFNRSVLENGAAGDPRGVLANARRSRGRPTSFDIAEPQRRSAARIRPIDYAISVQPARIRGAASFSESSTIPSDPIVTWRPHCSETWLMPGGGVTRTMRSLSPFIRSTSSR